MTSVFHDHLRIACILTALLLSSPAVTLAQFQHFVTIRGDTLMDGQQSSDSSPTLSALCTIVQATTSSPHPIPGARRGAVTI